MTKILPPPERIIWLYKRWQPLYDVIQETVYPKVDFIQGIPLDLDQDSFINPSARNLVILDDLMSTAAKDSRVNELFTEGSHHRNLSVIAINKNLYFNKAPTQRRNCHYLVMFKNPVDQQQVMTLARQMYPGNPQNLLKHFQGATSRPYGYLVIDLKPFTPEHLRMRTDVFDKKIIRGGPSDIVKETRAKSPELIPTTASYPSREEDMPSCDDCGLLFENIHNLQKHVKNWCHESSKRKRENDEFLNESVKKQKLDEWMHYDSDDSVDDYESEEKKVFHDFMDKVRTYNEKEWNQKYGKYRKEGMTREEASYKSEEKMLEKDLKQFNQEYGQVIKYILQLRRGRVHEKIMDDVTDFLDEGNDKQKAINLALCKNRYLFEDMWGSINDMLEENDPNEDDKSEVSDTEQ